MKDSLASALELAVRTWGITANPVCHNCGECLLVKEPLSQKARFRLAEKVAFGMSESYLLTVLLPMPTPDGLL